MKKTYQNPDIKIVMLNTTCQMLAGSDMSVNGDYDNKKVMIGARGGFWDDEEEE